MTRSVTANRLLIPCTMAVALMAAAAAAAETSSPAAGLVGGGQPAVLHIKPRYYRWYVNPGEQWVEKNTGYARLDWKIPHTQVALVLVDVWDRHYIEDTESRAEEIIQQNIRPLLAAARRTEIKVVHAPSPREAKLYQARRWPNRKAAAPAAVTANSTWPPREFRSKTGAYQQYARPFEPLAATRLKRLRGMRIHPDVEPVGDEVVVANGDELHQYCREHGILFLIYLGFNTNACILTRDYGTLDMGKRGYEIILLRDCTTGMESFESTDQLQQTRGAIQFLEMFGKYSITSQEFLAGLKGPD